MFLLGCVNTFALTPNPLVNPLPESLLLTKPPSLGTHASLSMHRPLTSTPNPLANPLPGSLLLTTPTSLGTHASLSMHRPLTSTPNPLVDYLPAGSAPHLFKPPIPQPTCESSA